MILTKRPVVGFFVDEYIVYTLQEPQARLLFRLNNLWESAEKAGVSLVVFSPSGVSFDPDRLNGVCFNPKLQRWQKVTVTRPDVLYDRYVGSGKGQVQADYIRRQFDRTGVKKINSRPYFDKLEVHEILSRDGRISGHLPLTRRLHGAEDLLEMFSISEILYLKSPTGRKGKQVIKVERLPGGDYAYSFYNNSLFSGREKDLFNLLKIIYSVTGEKDVLVQQAVDLVTSNNRVIDLRGELLRNGRGELEIVAVLVRIGNEGSPVATHGLSFMFQEFFQRRLRFSGKAIAGLKSNIDRFLLSVYASMEQAYGPFGEIAIDFGIDKSGTIWFLECNARSTKVSLCKAAGKKIIERAFLNPMLYAKLLYEQGR